MFFLLFFIKTDPRTLFAPPPPFIIFLHPKFRNMQLNISTPRLSGGYMAVMSSRNLFREVTQVESTFLFFMVTSFFFFFQCTYNKTTMYSRVPNRRGIPGRYLEPPFIISFPVEVQNVLIIIAKLCNFWEFLTPRNYLDRLLINFRKKI